MMQIDLNSMSNREPAFRERPVIFHGVNKSGSLSFAKALQKSYAATGRSEEYMCRYLGIPSTRDGAMERMSKNPKRRQILIDHGLVGFEESVPSAGFATLLRHPARRVLSCFFWLQSHHPDLVLGRDFSSWIRAEGMAYSQIRQFAYNHLSAKERGEITQMKIGDIGARAAAFFEDRVDWFGITELFEESLLTFHWELGLDHIAPWETDMRNTAQPRYDSRAETRGRFDFRKTTISNALYNEIESVMGPDIVFYEMMRQKFLKYLRGFSIDGLLSQYMKEMA